MKEIHGLLMTITAGVILTAAVYVGLNNSKNIGLLARGGTAQYGRLARAAQGA